MLTLAAFVFLSVPIVGAGILALTLNAGVKRPHQPRQEVIRAR